MGQKKEISGAESDLEKLQKQVQQLQKLTTNLQATQKIMSKSLKDLNKSIKFLTNTVQSNKEFIDSLNSETEEDSIDLPHGLTEVQGKRSEINRAHFVSALQRVLLELKKTDPKEFVEIKTVKHAFFERYYLENEEKFEQWLLESFWSNEIELLSGISDYSVRDIYDNVYHKIRY